MTRGAGSQFLFSLPNGGVNFAALELMRHAMFTAMPGVGLAGDFLTSAGATIIASIVSTPQMVVCDRVMAGIYENGLDAVRTISRADGLRGFYQGWTPG